MILTTLMLSMPMIMGGMGAWIMRGEEEEEGEGGGVVGDLEEEEVVLVEAGVEALLEEIGVVDLVEDLEGLAASLASLDGLNFLPPLL